MVQSKIILTKLYQKQPSKFQAPESEMCLNTGSELETVHIHYLVFVVNFVSAIGG